MHPNISFSCLEHNSCGNKRSRRASASATRGWHDDSTPGAGFLYNSLPLDSAGWHGDSPPEAGFSQCGRAHVHRPRLTSPNQTCLCRGAVSSWRSAGRRRHPSPTRRLPYSIEGPARAPASSKDEELAHGLADEPTWRLPASGWGFANSRQFGKQTYED